MTMVNEKLSLAKISCASLGRSPYSQFHAQNVVHEYIIMEAFKHSVIFKKMSWKIICQSTLNYLSI